MKLSDRASVSPATVSLKRLAVFALMVMLLASAGCKGCFEAQEAKKPTQKKKAKPNFEFQTPVTLPGYYPIDPREKKKLEEEAKDDEKKKKLLQRMDPAFRFNKAKPGHWVSIDFLAIANNFNADGYLETTSYQFNQPALIEGTDYFVQTSRPVNLVKGDWKKLETSVFIPRKSTNSKIGTINYVLDNGGSLPAINLRQPHGLLEDYQFHIVLLSTRSDSLKYLSFLDCVKLPGGTATVGDNPEFYAIVPTAKDDPVPLPGHSLNWTTIAYLIWDDLDPEALSRQQQQALVDWLHFGGQIIFSGPDCLDRLQTSFLADYLPGQFEESVGLHKSDVEALNNNWSIRSANNESDGLNLVIQQNRPLRAIRFKPHVEATFIEGAGELALERRIGRGRVVATAFSINSPQMKSWRSLSSFVHNALLRKPYRRFARVDMGVTTFRYQGDQTSIFDPLTGSTLRYVSRDLAPNEFDADNIHFENLKGSDASATAADRAAMDGLGIYGARGDFILSGSNQQRNREDTFHYGGFQSTRQSGVAGWNDDSGIASRARETLKKAARITPPSARFVMKMLGLYLLVLVPVNWLFFRLIGKIEWAWIAAPIIAIVGAVLVVRFASLDIGFVRSETHVGLLELHGDYERGHLTNYSALYTSLSTRYNVELDNLSGQSIPFANVAPRSFRRGETTRKVELNRTTTTDLGNFLVRSNSTGLLHSEMMLDVGGAFHLSADANEYQVENGSRVHVRSAGVVRRNGDDLEFAWIGDLAPGQDARLDFQVLDGPASSGWSTVKALVGDAKAANEIWKSKNRKAGETIPLDELATMDSLAADWDKLARILEGKGLTHLSSEVSKSALASALSEIGGSNVALTGIFDCISQNLRLGPGEFRLIGHTDQKMEQSKITPDATQAKHNLLVLVHLQHADLPGCRRDHNSISDFDRGFSNLGREEYETPEIEAP